MNGKGQGGLGVRVSSVSYTLDTAGAQAVCVTGEKTHALTSEGGDASEDGTGRGTPIVAFSNRGVETGVGTERLRSDSHGAIPMVAIAQNQRGEVRFVDPPPAVTCGGGKPGEGYPAAMIGSLVRRLTPRECERLMGWPDDWTRYRADGTEIKDGPRYRMCGNGVVGTVAAWLACRIRATLEPKAAN